MRKGIKYLALFVIVLVMAMGFSTKEVSATEISASVMASATVRTGTMGTNDKVQWSYDENTKTLTMTGKDSGLEQTKFMVYTGPIYDICRDVEKVILQDFQPVGSVSMLFGGLEKLETIEAHNFDTSNITDMSYMFYECGSLIDLDVSSFDTSNVTDMHDMFYDCKSLVSLDVSGFDTSNVINMRGMFGGCRSLSSLDVSGFDTSNVVSMNRMFDRCNNLASLDVSGFDTSNVTDMQCMFNGCEKLTSLNVSGFNTSKVTRMYSMFMNCAGVSSLDVSGFDTSKVTTMTQMFAYCSNLTVLDVSKFDTSSVTAMYAMFRGCSKLTSLNVSSFDTSKVTDMKLMFAVCSSLSSLDVSGFDTSKVTDVSKMFYYCDGLRYLDMSSFNTSMVTDMEMMLYGNRALEAVRTPKSMMEGQVIDLPLALKDSAGQSITQITSALCNKTLSKYILEIGADKTQLLVGEGLQLRVMLDKTEQPTADNNQYKWSTSSGNIVTVSETGVIKAVSAGTANIMVSKKDGGIITGIITLTVKDKVTLNKSEIKHWPIGQTGTLTAYVNGKQISGERMIWSSSHPEVVGCENGYLVGKGVGTTTISCTKEGGTVATCKVTVVKKLAITGQPAGQEVIEGDSAVFTVVAEGGGLSYQWQFKAPGASTWTNSSMPGAKTNSLTVVGETRRNGQQYRCMVKDGGDNKITSEAATLTVLEKLAITSQPTSQSVFEGESAVFEVTAKGYNLNYQWQTKPTTLSNWTNWGQSGTTNSSLTVLGNERMSGAKFRCLITDGKGNQISSYIVTLTVLQKPLILLQPASQSVMEGDTAVFRVNATGSNLSYRWQYKAVGMEEWKDSGLTGAKTANLTVAGEARRNGQQYRCVVTGAKGNKVISEAATLTVKVIFGIKSQPVSQSVEEGNSAVFTVIATGSNLNYQWQYKNAGANKWFNSGMKGATTCSITVQGTAARNGQKYRCIITDGNGNQLISKAVTLTVESKFAIIKQPTSQSVAEGDNAVFTVTATGSDLSYQWQYKNVGADKWFNSGMKGATTCSITVQGTAARNGQQYRCIVADGSGNTITSNAVTMIVK